MGYQTPYEYLFENEENTCDRGDKAGIQVSRTSFISLLFRSGIEGITGQSKSDKIGQQEYSPLRDSLLSLS